MIRFNIVTLFLEADIVVQAVIVLLGLASIWTWTIILGHALRIRRVGRDNARFEAEFWKAEDVDGFYEARGRDDLLVVTDIEAIRAASVLIHQRAMRGDEILTDATVTAAFLTLEGRPRRQPREWVERFERLQGEGGT